MNEEMKEKEELCETAEEMKSAETDPQNDTDTGMEEPTENEAKPESRAEKKKLKRVEAELEQANKKLEAKEAELKEEKDKYLRMIAEYDNFRRRTQKEKEATYTDAYADAVLSILPVIDNLERAEQYHDPESVQKGIAMTLKAAKETFEKLGITEVETKTFDPNFHNAVMHIEDESLGENEIVEVFQKGYRKGDRIIRFAMVKVAN